ncbi:MAG: hydroxypyruvate isomerase family protein [Pseudolabrys sp.]
MPRFAANIAYMFTERPTLLERVGAAARAGFKAIELQFPYDVPPATLKAEADKHGLTILGLNTERGAPDLFGLTAQPGRERDFDAAFAQAFDYAQAIGGNAVHCLAGKVAPEQRAAAERTYIANLQRAADRARGTGVKLLIEPINTMERPNYFLNYVEHAADILTKVERPNVKMQFDFYHVQIMQGDLIRRFEKHLPFVGHVQIAAVPSRHEPDEGEVNYPAIFDALDRLGYDGWVSCEYRNRARTEDGLGWGKAYGLRTDT